MDKFRFLAKSKISQLPQSPGVYAFKAKDRLIYVGKAINIRDRAKQHQECFALRQAERIGYIETGSEIAALILEANLIKKYQPKYNTAWKDGKNYFYAAITKEALPKVFMTHQTRDKNVGYLGPFVDGKALKQVLRILRKVFPYYSVGRHPKNLCLWCHMKLCPGPNPDIREYKNNIKNLAAVLGGKKKSSIIRDLKTEMKRLSEAQEFERALKIKGQIEALEKILSNARIFFPARPIAIGKRIEAYDISNIQGKQATGSMVVFTDCLPDKSQYRKFKIRIEGKPNDVAMLKETLARRFHHAEWPWPDLILIDGGKAQLNAALSITRNPDLRKFGFRVMSLAKRKNELFIGSEKKPVLLKTLPKEKANLILRLRDEAHRFALAYHHKLRTKDLIRVDSP